MPPPEYLKALGQRIVPIMEEFGVRAFVCVAYVESPDGTLKRACFANTAGNPAFQDGLRAVIAFANAWGADPVTHQKPDTPDHE